LHKESAFLVDQFLTVDSEEEWLALKEKYDSLTERMGEVKEENGLILQEVQENVQQNQKVENEAIKEEASRVWEHRYHELLEQY
jgi:division protein CdvB (Snf7/Vps24/ESCRT-III family)